MAIRFKEAGEGAAASGLEEQFRALSFDEQRSALVSLQAILEEGIQERRRQLESELAALDDYGSSTTASRAVTTSSRAIKRSAPGHTAKSKVTAKYRSKKDANLLWSGRGLSPRWLKEEMTESGQSKESFLISTTTD